MVVVIVVAVKALVCKLHFTVLKTNRLVGFRPFVVWPRAEDRGGPTFLSSLFWKRPFGSKSFGLGYFFVAGYHEFMSLRSKMHPCESRPEGQRLSLQLSHVPLFLLPRLPSLSPLQMKYAML